VQAETPAVLSSRTVIYSLQLRFITCLIKVICVYTKAFVSFGYELKCATSLVYNHGLKSNQMRDL